MLVANSAEASWRAVASLGATPLSLPDGAQRTENGVPSLDSGADGASLRLAPLSPHSTTLPRWR